jgi:hypothetical protein
MTLIAKVDTMSLFFFRIKKLKRLLIRIVAERADPSINSPLISAVRTEEESFSHFFLEQAQGGKGTADWAVTLHPGFGFDLTGKLFDSCFDRRFQA